MAEGRDARATDSFHPSGTHIDWSESFYFNFYDRKNDICGFTRIGLRPNRKEKSMFCFLLMPDGADIGTRQDEHMEDTNLRVNGLSYTRVVPDREWTLQFSGPMKRSIEGLTERKHITFNLRYTALNTVFDYRECTSAPLKETVSFTSAEHTEQFGRITGGLTVDGRAFVIDALGERDHSWGTSDWVAPSVWIWLSCQFSEKTAFNITRLFVGHSVVDAGFMHRDGENFPITKVVATTTYNEDGGPRTIHLLLQEKGGRTHEVSAEVLREKKMPFTGRVEKHLPVLHESLARYTMGDMVGYGIAEYLVRAK